MLCKHEVVGSIPSGSTRRLCEALRNGCREFVREIQFRIVSGGRPSARHVVRRIFDIVKGATFSRLCRLAAVIWCDPMRCGSLDRRPLDLSRCKLVFLINVRPIEAFASARSGSSFPAVGIDNESDQVT